MKIIKYSQTKGKGADGVLAGELENNVIHKINLKKKGINLWQQQPQITIFGM